MTRRSVLLLLVAQMIAVAEVVTGAVPPGWAEDIPAFSTSYQAVLLDNNQVYYGKISGLAGRWVTLRDVYYVRRMVNEKTKQAVNVLMRQGHEINQPDEMVINRHHILLIEPVGPNSRIAQLIAQAKSQRQAVPMPTLTPTPTTAPTLTPSPTVAPGEHHRLPREHRRAQ